MIPFARHRTLWLVVALGFAAAAPPRVTLADTPFSITTLDSLPNAGFDVAMVVDANGDPHIAYVQFPTLIVRYAHRSGGVWTTEDVGTGKQFWSGLAIALDAAGTPHIGYLEDDPASINDQVRLAVRTTGGWVVEPVDIGRLYVDFALDASGHPHFAYRQDFGTGRHRIRYARRDGSAWSYETADTSRATASQSSNFERISIAIDPDGEPAVAYHTGQGARNLGFARRAAGAWSVELADPAGCTGFMGDVRFDGTGVPVVSYLAGFAGEVRLASPDGLGGWVFQLVDGESWAPEQCFALSHNTSLVFDQTGAPRLAYPRIEPEAIVFAAEVDGQWVSQVVEAVSDAGPMCAIALLSDGRPVIAYGSDLGLRFAEATGPIVGVPPAGTDAAAFSLEPAAPNPVRPGAPLTLRFALPADAAVTVELSDVAGRRVGSRTARTFTAGPQSLRLETPGLAPGVYFARVAARGLGERVARFVVVD